MKIGIIGASGYTGFELLRLLASHPLNFEVSIVTSRQDEGKALTSVFPALSSLANYDELCFSAPTINELAGQADLFFIATPHGAAMALVPDLMKKGAKIIDLSADFRLRDLKSYCQWYQDHTAAELLSEAVYGLPELYADKIKNARLVANPGCYPTSIILGLAPLFKAGLVSFDAPIIADSASGLTGAGRGGGLGSAYCEVSDSFKAYKVVGHRHTPEIEQELSLLAKQDVRVSFTPHLLPLSRGILSTIYAQPNTKIDLAEIQKLYSSFYSKSPFVRVRPSGFEPQTSEVRGSNFCDISIFYDHRAGLIKVISVIDNLCRGASGQAVCNFNLMNGLEENAGLLHAPLRP